MKKWIALTAISGTLALTLAAIAAPRGQKGDGSPRGPEGPGPMMRILENPNAVEQLGLTEEQVTALNDLRYETEKASIALQSDARLAQLEVERILRSENPDEAAAHAAIEAAGQVQIKLKQTRVSAMLKAREILGEETLKEIQDKGRERMKQRANQMRERVQRFRERGPQDERLERPRGPRDGEGRRAGPPGV